MMKILYILRHSPLGISGGSKASLHYLKAFCEVFRECAFDVLICKEYIDKRLLDMFPKLNFVPVEERNIIKKICTIWSGITHRFQEKGTEYLRNGNYDYCVFDHSCIAGTLADVAKSVDTKTIVIHHNVETVYYSDNSNWLKRTLFLRHVASADKQSYLKCNVNIFVTEEDKTDFIKLYGSCDGKCCVQYVFEVSDTIQTTKKEAEKYTKMSIVISGSLSNIQNVDGIRYFINELYSTLPSNIKVIIAGKNPTNEVRKLLEGKSNIDLISNPPDMDKIISMADIFLCPTKLGSGIKVRITDGLKQGLPVIAHKVSVRGYNDFLSVGYMYPFESPQEFSDALRKITMLLESDSNLKKEIADYYFNKCSFKKSIETLKKIVYGNEI